MFVYETKGKYEKGRLKVIGCMSGGKRSKIMDNEENRCLIDKKDYEDQLVTFCQFYGVLATYEICYTKRWLNHFLEPSRNKFYCKKCYLLKTL